jgi:putative ABC transport system substrate-binding protein
MSYGPDIVALIAHAADSLDKIFKGANPADLPVEQPTKFEFVLNLKTAKALDLKLSESILLLADKVVE